MSSELTIDIQLTELGFSSWDFQLLKQKESPQTQDAAPGLEATTEPASAEDEEPGVSLGQNAHVASQSSSPSIQQSDSQTETDQIQPDPIEAPAEEKERNLGQISGGGSQIEPDGNGTRPDEQKGMRRTDGNWEIDVDVDVDVDIDVDDDDVNDEEEDEEDDDHIDDLDLTEDEDNSVFSSDTNGTKEHRCQVCDLTFSSQFQLEEHLHVHKGVRPYCCSECDKQFCHLENYRAHLRTHTTYACIICLARFASSDLLQTHLDSNHFEEEFYQCDFCKRIFVNMEECEKHVQSHQQEVKRYPCSECDRSFNHQGSLRRHLKWHKKSALICTDCGQAFSKKNYLLRHSFVHLGLLPYTCVHCKRHFRLASLYRKHQCKPESIQCVACLVVFKSKDDFENHKKNTGCWGHQMATSLKTNDIRCMECGEIFANTEELKKHAGTHQRIMKCSECGMGFRSSLMLMSHMGGHAAVRPCLCKECGLGFPHQHAYDSHLKTCGLVSPPEPSAKKPKPQPPPFKKKESTDSSKSKVLQVITLDQQKKVLQGVPLQTVASLSNQAKPSEGQWTLVLDKDSNSGNVPLVMFLPGPIPSASKSSQSPPKIVATSAVSEKLLSVPQIIDVPLASTSQAAKSDKPVLLKSLANPAANVLIPLTTGVNRPKMRWTVLDDQITSGSLINGAAPVELKQILNISQANTGGKQTIGVLSNLSEEVLNSLQKTKACSNLPSSSTDGAHNQETPLCLVKVKTERDDQSSKQTAGLDVGRSSSLNTAQYTSAALLTPNIKKEPEQWDEHGSSEASPHGSDQVNKDLAQCDVCGVVLSDKDMVHHVKEHSTCSDRTSPTSVSHLSPSPEPPCKKIHLG
ncbi:zinc finger protein 236 [Astyanax mexicanus]|uniref:Zinc finger protein 236 n=1 Tax=Astyanax mexicanus TaxID=7994 RepID=A0A8B9JTL5_ASTMX|nr:zinc finger protein 236 [Astyanax mexicanus]